MEDNTVKYLNDIAKEKLLGPIAGFMLGNLRMLKNIVEQSVVIEDETTVINLTIGEIAFSFCFWKDRFSFFIEEKEVLDDYLTNLTETDECLNFLETVFCNSIEIEYQATAKDKTPSKIIYRYFIKKETGEKPVLVEDKETLKFSFYRRKIVKVKRLGPLI